MCVRVCVCLRVQQEAMGKIKQILFTNNNHITNIIYV